MCENRDQLFKKHGRSVDFQQCFCFDFEAVGPARRAGPRGGAARKIQKQNINRNLLNASQSRNVIAIPVLIRH